MTDKIKNPNLLGESVAEVIIETQITYFYCCFFIFALTVLCSLSSRNCFCINGIVSSLFFELVLVRCC